MYSFSVFLGTSCPFFAFSVFFVFLRHFVSVLLRFSAVLFFGHIVSIFALFCSRFLGHTVPLPYFARFQFSFFVFVLEHLQETIFGGHQETIFNHLLRQGTLKHKKCKKTESQENREPRKQKIKKREMKKSGKILKDRKTLF